MASHKQRLQTTLADGQPTDRILETYHLPVCLGGRRLFTDFVVLPESINNRTLLGCDFIEGFGMVIDTPRQQWHFFDEPSRKFKFEKTHFRTDETQAIAASNQAPIKEVAKPNKPPKAKVANEVSAIAQQKETPIRQSSKKPCPGTKEEMDVLFDRLYRNYDNFKKGVDSAFEEDWMQENMCDNIFIGAVEVRLKYEEAPSLDDAQREELNSLLLEFQDIFETEGPPTTLTEHCINTGDSPPISVPPYRLSPAKREVLKQEIAEMLRLGVIEECDSP